MKNIILIGMPGCGKTTIGKALAEEKGLVFCDLDEYIEITNDKSIPQIFENGEEAFRKIEKKALEQAVKNENTVISTGGGIVKDEGNIEILQKAGIVIFIDRPLKNIISDVDTSNRPLLAEGKEKLYSLYNERFGLYIACCHHRIINDSSIENAVARIEQLI